MFVHDERDLLNTEIFLPVHIQEIDDLIDLEEENADTIKLINAVPDTLKDEVKELKSDEDE